MTDAERTLWRHLRLRQMRWCKFRRQQPIGPYIIDFVCFEKRLVIELDGGQHSSQTSYDLKRTAWLEGQGFQVLRFWNNKVLKEMEVVKQVIWEKLTHHLTPPPPLPSPGGRVEHPALAEGD